MPQATSSDARQRPDLATFAQLDLEMQRRGYIATSIMPALGVMVSSGKYRRISLKSLLANANADAKRTSKGGYNEGDFEYDSVSFQTEEYGWKSRVDEREANIYGENGMLEEIAALRAWEVLLNKLEGRVLAKAVDATVTASQTNAAAAVWTNLASATPIDDIETACNAVYARTGMWPNTVAMSRKRFRNARRSEQVLDALHAAGAGEQALQGSVTAAKLAEVFDVERVLVSNAIKNTANIGAAASIASIFPDDKIWVGVTSNSPDLQSPCFGRILHWGGDGSEIGDDERLIGVVEEYRNEDNRSDYIRVRHETEEHTVYSEMAQVITGAQS